MCDDNLFATLTEVKQRWLFCWDLFFFLIPRVTSSIQVLECWDNYWIWRSLNVSEWRSTARRVLSASRKVQLKYITFEWGDLHVLLPIASRSPTFCSCMLSRATLLTSVGARHCDFRSSSVMAMAAAASPWTTSFTQSGVSTSRGSSSNLRTYPCLSSRTHMCWCAPSLLPLRPQALRLNRKKFSGASRLPLTVALAIVQEEKQAGIGLKTFLEELKAVGRVSILFCPRWIAMYRFLE